jgi:hypothetical protein
MVKKGFKPKQIIGRLREAKVLIEQRRREYNQVRLHSSPGYRPPAPEANGITLIQDITVCGGKATA